MPKSSLRIGLVSATGKEGPPLALRWTLAGHYTLIGSRRLDKAEQVAHKWTNKLRMVNNELEIKYGINTTIMTMADVIVLTMPYGALNAALSDLKEFIRPNMIVICPVCPLKVAGGELGYETVPEGSVAEFVGRCLPQALVVGAFHTVSAARLADLSKPVEGDVPVCSDHVEAKKLVMGLVSDIPNLRPIDGGRLRNSHVVEELATLVINIGRRISKPDLGVRFV